MYYELFTILAPVFAGIGLGAIWGTLKLPYDQRFVTSLVMHIGTPFLIFSTLTKLAVSPADFAVFAGYGVLTLLSLIAVGVLLLKTIGYPVRDYLTPIVFPNAGNMGLPICLFAYGPPGLALAIGFFAVMAVGQFALSPLVYSNERRPSPLLVFKLPPLWAIGFAVVFMATGTKLPLWAERIVDLFGAIAIPLLVFALGVSLTRIRVTNLRRSLLLTILRIGTGFIVGLGLAAAFGLEGMPRGILVLQCSMPAAVFSYLFAAQVERVADDIASLVFVSTVTSFVTLPLILLLVLGI